MRVLSSYIFRALCAMLVGFLLVSNPQTMTTLLVQIIGGLFTLSGVVAVIGYFVNNHQHERRVRKAAQLGQEAPRQSSLVNMFPVVGIGSLAFGVFLLLMPNMFIHILMYVLGLLMVLAGASQCWSLVSYRKVAPLTWSAFVLPLLILAAGIYVLCQPSEGASLPFTILGIACICYGVAEFFNGLRLHRFQRRLAKAQAEAARQAAEEAEVVEVIEEEAPMAEEAEPVTEEATPVSEELVPEAPADAEAASPSQEEPAPTSDPVEDAEIIVDEADTSTSEPETPATESGQPAPSSETES